ncbi:MAG: 50S ribosomal protein L23 [Methanosarcinales archaeon]|nr:MAG: 50S ribosomal protein L23 [Methanosarcinales archaeon]
MKFIKHPFMTEKATMYVDDNNKLQFIVDVNASKPQIVRELEKIYDVKVADVNTMITPKGNKKTIITFTTKGTASKLASQFGIY